MGNDKGRGALSAWGATVGALAIGASAIAITNCADHAFDAPASDADGDVVSSDASDEADVAEPPPPPTEGSGSRFRTMHVVTAFEDGTTQRTFSAFFDRELGTTCRIQEIGPDRFACLPDDLAMGDGDAFADSACQKPVLAIDRSSGVGSWARWGSPCAPKFGLRGTITTSDVYRKDPTTQDCVPMAVDAPTIPVPEEVPVTTFGVFTRTVETAPFPGERSGQRLVAESDRFTGTDGSFEWRAARIVDVARKSTGAPGFATDESLRFLTSYGTIIDPESWFVDGTCTQPTLSFERDLRTCRDDARARDGMKTEKAADGTCFVSRVFERPAQAPASTLYAKYGSACSLELPPVGYDVYPSTPLVEVPADAFVPLTRAIVPSNVGVTAGTALDGRAVAHSSPDGLYVRDRRTQLYLRELDLACVVDFITNDESRCVPDVPLLDEGSPPTFADPACTQQLLSLFGAHDCGMPASRYYRTSFGSFFARAFALPTEPTRPAVVYQRDDSGACKGAPPPGGYLYAPKGSATALALTKFPKVVRSDIVIDR